MTSSLFYAAQRPIETLWAAAAPSRKRPPQAPSTNPSSADAAAAPPRKRSRATAADGPAVKHRRTKVAVKAGAKKADKNGNATKPAAALARPAPAFAPAGAKLARGGPQVLPNSNWQQLRQVRTMHAA